MFKGKTLGLIGFGKIGQRVAKLVKAFGVEVIFYDKCEINLEPFKQVPLDVLLEESDIISLHVSSKETLIAEADVSKMKKCPIIINTSRGSVIDEKALQAALVSAKVSFAGLDVYSSEPYQGGLKELANVVLTPHIGSYAKEARIEMEKEAVENLIKGFKKEGYL